MNDDFKTLRRWVAVWLALLASLAGAAAWAAENGPVPGTGAGETGFNHGPDSGMGYGYGYGFGGDLEEEEQHPTPDEAAEHPFGGEEDLIESFRELISDCPDVRDRIRRDGGSEPLRGGCDGDPCTNHTYQSLGQASVNPSATVSIYQPFVPPGQRLKIKIGAQVTFYANGSFNPGIMIPPDWLTGHNHIILVTQQSETQYHWSGGGNNSTMTRKFPSKGDYPVSVTYQGSQSLTYTLCRHCTVCGHESTTQRVVSPSAVSSPATVDVRVFTMDLGVCPEGGGGYGGSATIGAGGVNSPPHRAQFRARLDPAGDPGDSMSFAVKYTVQPGGAVSAGAISATHAGNAWSHLSSQHIGGSYTVEATDEGVLASATATYASNFYPEPQFSVNAGGGLEGEIGVQGGGQPLDQHPIRATLLEMKVQKWDPQAKQLVTETRSSSVPRPFTVIPTGTDGLAAFAWSHGAGDRVLSAKFLFEDLQTLE